MCTRENHQIFWKEEKILQNETNTTYRKYKELAQISLPVSQPSWESSLIWTPIIEEEVSKLQLCPL